MIEIRSTFTPFKMKISRREPITLSVELSNSGSDTEIVTMNLNLGDQFSLEKTGYKNIAIKKMPEFKAGDSKKFYFDIWPKQMARAGEQGIKLAVTEHYNSFEYVKRTYDKVLRVSVEE